MLWDEASAQNHHRVTRVHGGSALLVVASADHSCLCCPVFKLTLFELEQTDPLNSRSPHEQNALFDCNALNLTLRLQVCHAELHLTACFQPVNGRVQLQVLSAQNLPASCSPLSHGRWSATLTFAS